jgi:transcriptional regulator with XRE-family HTH domain
MKREANSATFDDDLLAMINDSVDIGQVILTLGRARPNTITWINEDGVWVRTEKSDREGAGPQLVPAWMIAAAWQHLTQRGRLSQQELLEELNVKRSAFVCALLAHFPDVEVESGPPSSNQSVALVLSPHARSETQTGSLRHQGFDGDHVSRSTEPQSADAPFAHRLSELLKSNPYSIEDFADALSDEGVIMATEIATRLLAGKGGIPSDSVVDALARVFDVEPESFYDPPATETIEEPRAAPSILPAERHPLSEDQRAEHPATPAKQANSHLWISLQEFGRMIQALAEGTDGYLAQPKAELALAAALTRTVSALGHQLGQAEGGKVPVPRDLLEEVVLAWARMGPSGSAFRADFLWLAELLGSLPT